MGDDSGFRAAQPLTSEQAAAHPTPHRLVSFGDDAIYDSADFPAAPGSGGAGAAGPDAGAAAAAPAAAPPPPPPPPPAPPELTPRERFDSVLGELQAAYPQTDGRWTASQAAQTYGDNEFIDQNLGAQLAAADYATANQRDDDGRLTDSGYAQTLLTGAAVDHALTDLDTSRNRYQQTTGFDADNAQYAAARHDEIDQATSEALRYGLDNPASSGIGFDEESARAFQDARQHAFLAGDENALDPAWQGPAALSDEQYQELEDLANQ